MENPNQSIIHVTSKFFPARGWAEGSTWPIIREQSRTHRIGVIWPADSSQCHGKALGIDLFPTSRSRWQASFTETCEKFGATHVIFHSVSLCILELDLLEVIWRLKQKGVTLALHNHDMGCLCLRKDFLRLGKLPCDSPLRIDRCAECALDRAFSRRGLKLPTMVSSVGTLTTLTIGRALLPERTDKILGLRGVEARRSCLDLLDKIIVWNQSVKQAFENAGITGEKIEVCNQVPYLLTATPGPSTRRHSSGLIFGYVGRYEWVKGITLLKEAITLLNAQQLEFTVVLYGIESQELRARQSIAELKKMSNVIVNGPLAEDQVIGTMAGFDALLIPSIFLETGPNVLQEAFAAGIPVICSDWGGTADQVTPDVDGLLFRWSDSISLAATMKRFITSPALRAQLRMNVAARPIARIGDFMKLYNAALAI